MLDGPMRAVGVIGQGFVGTAVREGLRHAFDVVTYDKKDGQKVLTYGRESTKISLPGLLRSPVDLMVDKSDGIVFLCLPTPMLPEGHCDLSIVRGVVNQLALKSSVCSGRLLLVIKSTVPPGTTEKLAKEYPWVDFCFQPEFLTEANAVADFKAQTRIVCGGSVEAVIRVRQLYSIAYPTVRFVCMTSTGAELVKYFTNAALACRVSLANEFYQIATALGVEYEDVIEVAKLDARLGGHWTVPGGDGHFGFGGSCFPKDLNALISAARALRIEPMMLVAAWEKNLAVRPERDWEQLVGRAVSEEVA